MTKARLNAMGEKVRDMGAKDRTYRIPRSASTLLSHEQLAAQAEAMESQELSSTVQSTNEHTEEMRTEQKGICRDMAQVVPRLDNSLPKNGMVLDIARQMPMRRNLNKQRQVVLGMVFTNM